MKRSAAGGSPTSPSGAAPSAKRSRDDAAHSAAAPAAAASPPAFFHTSLEGGSSAANRHAVSLEDVFAGEWHFAFLANSVVDLDWLVGRVPRLLEAPSTLAVDARGAPVASAVPPTMRVFSPEVSSHGVHNSKAAFLFFHDRVRLCVHTAGYTAEDWQHRTQGVWMQEFPLLPAPPTHQGEEGKGGAGAAAGAAAGTTSSLPPPQTRFEQDLRWYLEAYTRPLQAHAGLIDVSELGADHSGRGGEGGGVGGGGESREQPSFPK